MLLAEPARQRSTKERRNGDEGPLTRPCVYRLGRKE